jgi:hypothetical protein
MGLSVGLGLGLSLRLELMQSPIVSRDGTRVLMRFMPMARSSAKVRIRFRVMVVAKVRYRAIVKVRVRMSDRVGVRSSVSVRFSTGAMTNACAISSTMAGFGYNYRLV